MTINGKKVKYLYMATTRDKYELPIAVADSTKELADMLGMEHKTVSMYMSPCNEHRKGFYKINVEDED